LLLHEKDERTLPSGQTYIILRKIILRKQILDTYDNIYMRRIRGIVK
jgi:hypothetical protein